MGNFISGLIGLAIAFVLLNGVLWVGQEAYHYSDVKRCEILKNSLNSLELQLNQKKNEIESNQVNLLKRSNDIAAYKQLIATYNDNVNEYNTLSKSAYKRWYLIPIPGFHGRAH